MVSKSVSLGKNAFKYFVDYKDGRKISFLFLAVPKMAAYRRDFNEFEEMFFSIKAD